MVNPRWRTSITRERHRRRVALRAAQNNRCALCGQIFGGGTPTFEHVVPRHRGGRNYGNLVLTHPRCNMRRADALPTGCLLIMLDVVNARLGL